MFQLDQVLEYWATKYKRIKHDPAAKSKDKGFFRIQELDLQSEWSRNMNLIDKPCLLFRMAEDGSVNADNTNRLDRFWGMYLAVKQKGAPNNVVDELGAADCMTQWGLAPCVLSVMAHWCLSPSCVTRAARPKFLIYYKRYSRFLHVSRKMPIFATSKSIQRHEDVTSRDERHFLCP